MLIMTISPSTSAASTDGLRERTVASVMTEVGSVLDTVGIAVAPVGEASNLFPARGDVEGGSGPVQPGAPRISGRRINARRRDAALLACAAGCYGLRWFRLRRWAGGWPLK